jgi:hypothetical protein
MRERWKKGLTGVAMTENSIPDWERLAELAAGILTCPQCERWSSTKPPEPFWVGSDYRRGGIVLLARNPADKDGRPLPPEAQGWLGRLRDSHAEEDFRAWADWRRHDMLSRWSDGKPWDQWANAFKHATHGAASPNKLAWLNVLPACTAGDSPPPNDQLQHGRDEHLRPALQELRPKHIIWRYADAQRATVHLKSELQGAWRTDLGMGGITASAADRERINRELRAERTR